MVGQKLKHYEIERLLGRGGMGVVYKARDVRLGRPVALKVLKEEVASNEDRKRRFLQEARSASAVSHPAIAQVFDVDESEGLLFMALEFVEGRTVRQLIHDRELDLLGSIEIGIQITGGLAKAHSRGIIHRDIKSDNIMVTPDGQAKILDFGLAKLLDPDGGSLHGSSIETMAQTQVGTVLGTVAYMSPEQARGKTVDHRSDLFSVGIVLYEMVTGELPFKGSSPLDTMHAIAFEEVRPVTVLRRDLPGDLQRVLSRCMRKKPDDRYPSAEALLEDLEKLKQNLETGSQQPVSFQERLEGFLEWLRFSIPYGIGGSVALAAVLLLLGFLFFSQMEVGTVLLLLLIGLPVYRYVRNRKSRLLQRFLGKVSRFPEVRAVTVRDDLVTLYVENPKAGLYIRVNSMLETVNKKLFYGDRVEVAIRDNFSEQELQTVLREPGVRYVKEGAVSQIHSPPPSPDQNASR